MKQHPPFPGSPYWWKYRKRLQLMGAVDGYKNRAPESIELLEKEFDDLDSDDYEDLMRYRVDNELQDVIKD